MNAQINMELRGILVRPTWGWGAQYRAGENPRPRAAHVSQQLWLLNLEEEATWEKELAA